MQSNITKRSLDVVFSLLVVYALLGAVCSRLSLLHRDGIPIIEERVWPIVTLLAVSLWAISYFVLPGLARLLERYSEAYRYASFDLRALPRASLIPAPFVVGFLLLLCSDYLSRSFIFFRGLEVRSEILLIGVLVLVVTSLRANSEIFERVLSWRTLLLVQVVVAIAFLSHADGRLLFSDDHPSFLYRFQLLAEHFPRIPFYNAEWNAGYSAREFLPSGMLNVFLFTFPFLFWSGNLNEFSSSVIYTYFIPYLFVFLLPLSVYFAARVFRLTVVSAAIAGLLALAPTLEFFEWLLKYGTIGFAFAAGVTPLALALSYRLAVEDEVGSWWHLLALLLASFLAITWTPNFLSFLPIVFLGLYVLLTRFSQRRALVVFVFLLLFALVNFHWISVFIEESKVFSFVSGSTLPGSDVQSFDGVKKELPLFSQLSKRHEVLQESLVKMNPLLYLFFLPGLFFFSSSRLRILLGTTVGWLIFVALVGDLIKPQLELKRMLVPASFLMCLPVAEFFSKMFEKSFFDLGHNNPLWRWRLRIFAVFVLVGLLGAVFHTPFVAAAAYQNRTVEKFRFAPPLVENLANAIAEHGGEGRVFFLGFVLHEFGARSNWTSDGGHIAPLVKFSGKPMYASDFYHTRWSTVDPIPPSYRKRKKDGIEEFLDLVNASSVVAFRPEWQRYCLKHPDIYKEVYRENNVRLFTRKPPKNGYFLKGEGEIQKRADGFIVLPESEELVLKFRFLPKLRSAPSDGVEIYPVPVFVEEKGGGKVEQVSFIGLRVRSELAQNRTPIVLGYRVSQASAS